MAGYILILIGFIVGGFGTLIGAGGGFILVPILLLMYPDKSPELITSISLAVVCLNAASGSIAYAFKKRIDYRSAIIFSITTLPGSIIGAYLTSYIPRGVFNIVFALLLMAISITLIIRPLKSSIAEHHLVSKYLWPTVRKMTDKYGKKYTYRYDIITACVLSFFVGIASSLLGIGGGIIHVPAMVNLLNFPVHIATATSHFLLAAMGFSGSAVHYFKGDLQDGYHEIIFLGIGVIAGAQIGAALSNKVKEGLIIRSLAVALGIVAVRILLLGIQG